MYMGYLGLEENLDLLAHLAHVGLLDHQGIPPWDEKCHENTVIIIGEPCGAIAH